MHGIHQKAREAKKDFLVTASMEGRSLTLVDYTSPGLIIPYLRSQDAATVIQELASALHREGEIPDLLQFYQAALNREYLSGTITDPGWALPHARIRGLKEARFAFGRWPEPVSWLANSPQKARAVFLLAVPETDARTYLNLISGIARLSKQTDLSGELFKAKDTFAILNVLAQVKLHVLASPP